MIFLVLVLAILFQFEVSRAGQGTCPLGFIGNGDILSGACTKCPSGQYRDSSISVTSSSCTACPAFASSDAGSPTCYCNNGYVTSGTGSTLTCTAVSSGQLTTKTCNSPYAYSSTYGMCYYENTAFTDWWTAVSNCNSQGNGWLAEINSLAELSYISNVGGSQSLRWTGAYKTCQSCEWYYTHGSMNIGTGYDTNSFWCSSQGHDGGEFVGEINWSGWTLGTCIDDYPASGATYSASMNSVCKSYPTNVAITIPSPTSYWPMSVSSTVGTTSYDTVGGWNLNLLNGASVVSSFSRPGSLAGSLQLSGSSQCAQIIGSQTFGGAMSMSMWGYITGNANSASRFFDFGNGPNSDNVGFTTNGLLFTFSGSTPAYIGTALGGNYGSWTWYCPSVAGSSYAWVHVVTTIDASGNGNIYYNGALCASGSVYTPSTLARSQLYFGYSEFGNPIYIGYFSDFKMYNVALSASQVTAIYASYSYNSAPNPVCPPPTNYWPMSIASTSGTTSSDLIGGWNLALQGGATTSTVSRPGSTAGSLYLAGGSQYASISTQTFGGAMSMTMWGYITGNAGTWSRFFDFGTGVTNNVGFATNGALFTFSGSTPAYLGTALGGQYQSWSLACSSVDTSSGTWIHVAITIDASGNGNIYFNGALCASGLVYTPLLTSRSNMYFGLSNFGNPIYIGYYSDFRMYNIALSGEQVASVYNGVCFVITPSATPTAFPTSPTHKPTHPTNAPTTKPTTKKPSLTPSLRPTKVPSSFPTSPTAAPTAAPTTKSQYIAAFTTTQFLNGANQSTLVSSKTQNAFVSVMKQIFVASGQSSVSVNIISIVQSSSSTYGYAYNVSYLVPNGSINKLMTSYQNLTTTISQSTASNAVASSLLSACLTGCGLPSTLTVASETTSMTGPTFIFTPTPTSAPTYKLTTGPTLNPTGRPTSPTAAPSLGPTSPTQTPSKKPLLYPTMKPSKIPTTAPSVHSLAPTNQGQCFCNVRYCGVYHGVTYCAPGAPSQVYH